jgi:hypothetical protein
MTGDKQKDDDIVRTESGLTFQKPLEWKKRDEEIKQRKKRHIEESRKRRIEMQKQMREDLEWLRNHAEGKYITEYLEPFAEQLRKETEIFLELRSELIDARKEILELLDFAWNEVSERQKRLEENWQTVVEKVIQKLKVIDSRSKAQD